jgi:putative PIN family toxin of toxin-antitoxin system
LSPKPRKLKPRVVIDTSVLVAGISGFRDQNLSTKSPSADIFRSWAEKQSFLWLITEDILNEYKEILQRLRVRPHLIGRVVNLIRERAEVLELRSAAEISTDPKDDAFCLCANEGKAEFLVTLNLKDFPQARLKATVVSPDGFLALH